MPTPQAVVIKEDWRRVVGDGDEKVDGGEESTKGMKVIGFFFFFI